MKLSLLLLTISLFASQSFAQEDVAPAEQETEVASAETAPKEKNIAIKIEEKFGLSQEEIAKYREAKLGYGQIMMMAEFSKKSGKSTDEMIALLKEKKSVRKVASELNISKEDMGKMIADRKGMRKEHQERHQQRREERREARRDEKREGRNEGKKSQGRHR